MRDRVIRRDPSRSPLLDVSLDAERLKIKLAEKWYDEFFRRYPAQRNPRALAKELAPALTNPPAHLAEILSQWHPDTGIFQAIAHWSRLERAWREGHERSRAGVIDLDGMTIPRREVMPTMLAKALARGEKPRRRVVRPRTG